MVILLFLLTVHATVVTALLDPYSTLSVHPSADIIAIKRAYKRLAKQWHPDKNASPEAKSRFVDIGNAYQLLSDPERRRRYDLHGDTDERVTRRDFDRVVRNAWSAHSDGPAFRLHAHASRLRRQAVTQQAFEQRVRPGSWQRPCLLMAYVDWCPGCVRVIDAWHSLSEQLPKVGVDVATVHVQLERQLAEQLAVGQQLPQLVLVVDGQLFYYQTSGGGGAVTKASVGDFVSEVLVDASGMILGVTTLSQLQRELQGWSDNRVRAVVYSHSDSVRLRYSALAFQYRALVALVHVHIPDADQELLTHFVVSAEGDSLQVFKELSSTQPVAQLSSSSDGSVDRDGRLSVSAMSRLMDRHRFLLLPRLSSQATFDWLCPIEPTLLQRHLCAVVLTNSADGTLDFGLSSLRRYLSARQSPVARTRYVHVHIDRQVEFWRAVSASCTGVCSVPPKPVGTLLLVWRTHADQFQYKWMTRHFLPDTAVDDANSSFSELDQLLEQLVKLPDSEQLPQRVVFSGQLRDERAASLLRRVLARAYRALQYVRMRLGRDQLVPALSGIATLLVLVAGGYLMAHLARLEEANVQRQYRVQGRSADAHGSSAGSNGAAGAPSCEPPQLRVHELRCETFNGLIRLLKPGCRTLIVLVDSDSRHRLLSQFRRAVWPYRRNRTLLFAFLLLERGLEWYKRLLMPHLDSANRQLNINPKNCIGTVLSVNGHRKYFCMFHAKHAETGPSRRRRGPRTADFLGLESDSEEEHGPGDMERGGRMSWGESVRGADVLFEEHLLDGLPDWLDRLFEGQTVRYHLNFWPDYIGK